MKKEIIVKLPKIGIPKFMKSHGFCFVSTLLISIYMFFSLIAVVVGITDIDGYSGDKEDCQKVARIDYIFPGHQLGCYLGKPLEE